MASESEEVKLRISSGRRSNECQAEKNGQTNGQLMLFVPLVTLSCINVRSEILHTHRKFNMNILNTALETHELLISWAAIFYFLYTLTPPHPPTHPPTQHH
jgi:hypothetical protein